MAQAKEQSQAMAQSRNNNASESTGEKRPRTRRPYYQRRPRRPQQPKEAAVPIHIYPLGGLGEVGKNMTVYECCGDMIIVDCGLVFPDSDMYGVDLVIPDFAFVVQSEFLACFNTDTRGNASPLASFFSVLFNRCTQSNVQKRGIFQPCFSH